MKKASARRMTSDLAPASDGDLVLVVRGLEALGGAVLVAGDDLRVIAVTRAAGRLLGAPIRPGAHLVRILCGEGVGGPVAEALASGLSVLTWIPCMTGSGPERRIRVRAVRLDLADGGGWLVRLSAEPPALDDAPVAFGAMWTRDPAMKRTLSVAEAIATTDANVVVEGEAGTGKATLAAAMHARSDASAEPLRTVIAVGATPELLEGLLLGDPSDHLRALFLDDASELPEETQGYLLRTLESGLVTPRAGGAPVPVSVRVFSATRAPLEHAVEAGRFRADLMYRLRTVSLRLPPLRARRGDVRLLVETTLEELAARGGRAITEVAQAAWTCLAEHPWPGNVRELRVAIQHAQVMGKGPVLRREDLPPELAEPLASGEVIVHPAASPTGMDEAMRIQRAIERAGGERARAAAMLGMSRSTLWRRMRALGLAGDGGKEDDDA